MKSRVVILSALVLLVSLAGVAAAVQQAAPVASNDPWIGASTITSEAPADRKSCTYFSSQCAEAELGQHCGPLPSSNCVCDVRPSGNTCVSGG